MLETLREYALERLRDRGEEDAARRAHAGWYLDFAERAEPHVLAGPDEVAWIDRVEREHDNVRAALAWAVAAGETDLALRLATAVARFWHLRGHFNEGRQWLADAIRAAPGAEPELRARAYAGAATLARIQGDYTSARALLEGALGAYRDAGHRKGIGRTLSNLGGIAVDEGELEHARDLHEQGVELLRQLGDEHELAGALDNLADLALNTGDYARAAAVSEEALELYRRGGSRGRCRSSPCSTRRSPRCTRAATTTRARSSARASPARRCSATSRAPSTAWKRSPPSVCGTAAPRRPRTSSAPPECSRATAA